MNDSFFVDTNILVYSRDRGADVKHEQALSWISLLWEKRIGKISFQVLSEYYITVTKKLTPALDKISAREDVRQLLAWSPEIIDSAITETAWKIQDSYKFSWWDSLIVASALNSKANYLLTEDLSHKQRIDNLTIINPFNTKPTDII